MSVEAVLRPTLHLDSTLFPKGLVPESIVQVTGTSGSGKTILLTNLLAKFLIHHPEKRAIYIDTTSHFSAEHLIKTLRSLDSTIPSAECPQNSQLLSYLSRVERIDCFSPEKLLFTLGPKNASLLEKMLIVASDFSLVLIDSLDRFTYCPTLRGIPPDEYPDLLRILKRSVAPTQTQVICSMTGLTTLAGASSDAIPDDPSPTPSSWEALLPGTGATADAKPNLTFDTRVFTHTIRLVVKNEGDSSTSTSNGEQQIIRTAYLRCNRSPNTALSVGSHCAKFSILSGIVTWI